MSATAESSSESTAESTTAPPGGDLLRPGASLSALVALACTCAFMVVMDTSIVNVALPSMRDALGLSAAGQQWVVGAYLLALGGLLLLGARASDLFGRRTVLLIGIVVFVVGSLAGGLAGSGSMLIAARAVQGVGGAVLSPSGLALIIATHHDGQARGKAMSLYAACGAVAATAGVLIGGALTQVASWRWVMFVNVPVGLALFVAVLRLLAPQASTTRRRLDVAGAVTVTVGMAALIEGFSRAQTTGWASTSTQVFLCLAVVVLAAFVVVEAAVGDPLVRLDLFRVPGVAAGNLIIACNGIVLTASTYFVSLVLQRSLGFGALRAGLGLAPLALSSGVVALLSAGAFRRFGPRRVLLAGLLLAAAGFAGLGIGLHAEHPRYASAMLAPLLVIGAGLGLTIMPSTRAAAAGVPPQDAGLAGGIFNASRQIGAAIGVAVLTTLAVTAANHRVRHGASATAGQLHGDSLAILACGGVCILAALASFLLPRAAGGRAD